MQFAFRPCLLSTRLFFLVSYLRWPVLWLWTVYCWIELTLALFLDCWLPTWWPMLCFWTVDFLLVDLCCVFWTYIQNIDSLYDSSVTKNLRMPRNLSREERNQILVLHNLGRNILQISQELNVTVSLQPTKFFWLNYVINLEKNIKWHY